MLKFDRALGGPLGLIVTAVLEDSAFENCDRIVSMSTSPPSFSSFLLLLVAADAWIEMCIALS